MRTRLIFVLALLTALPTTAAHAQPTLSKVFTPNTIGPGSVSTITFTITNGSGVPVTNLAFTDNLPAAPGPMVIADPANASTTCDMTDGGILTAPDGGSTITLSNARIGASQFCTVTVDVIASTPGVHTNPAITLTSSAGSNMSLAIDLTVVTTLPGFSKSFTPSAIALGERSTLTFTFDNTLNANRIGNLEFADNLPGGMVVADPANVFTDCISASLPDTTVDAVPGSSVIALDANGSSLFAGFEVLSPGATCTVAVDVLGAGVGILDNVTNEALADFTSVGKASDTLAVSVTPLAIRKAFTDDPVPPGNNATLEFVIDNFDRFDPATGVAFTDDLTTLVPALPGLTFASLLSNDCGGSVSGVGGTTIGFSGGTVPAEGSCTIRVSLAVPAAATPGAYTNTTSTVTATVGGSPVVGNAASEDLFVEPIPTLTKEFLEDGTLAPNPVINPGDDVVLRFTITNSSTTSAATDIAFIDELTNGGPGTGFLPFPVMVTLPPVPNPPCGVGSSLALVIVPGESDRQQLTLTGGNLTAAPGAGATCSFDVTVTVPSDVGPGIYTNTTGPITATVDGATRTGDPGSDTVTVIAAPDLNKTFADPVAPGASVTLEFSLSYPPDASGNATDIAFTDDLTAMGIAGLVVNLPPVPDPPCGAGSTLTAPGDVLTLTNGTLTPGQTCTFSVTLDVPVATVPGNYTNTTSAVSATVQGTAATSAATSDILNIAGLVFTKEFLDDPAVAGNTVNLRFTIANIHPTDDATITFFTDNLSAALTGLAATGPPSMDTCGGALSGTTFLTYVGGSVMSGMSCVIEVLVLVPLTAPDGTYGNITSSLSANQGGAVVIDAAADALVVDSNRIQLDKAFTDDPVAPGDTVTLEFTLTNLDATSAITAIDFDDNLALALSGLIFDSVLFDDCLGTVMGTGTSTIDVSGVTLAAGASCTLRVSVTVPGAAAAGVYTNTTSSLTGTLGGLAVVGDPASDDLDIVQLLDFSKSFDGPTTPGGTATLTFTITNPGTDAVTGLDFSDDLDSVLSGLIATSLPSLPCGPGSSITGISFLTFTGGELAAMDTCMFDVDVLVPASATAGTYPNTTSTLFQNGLFASDPATADLVIEPPPTFAKVFAPDSIPAGGISTLTFTIDNSASALAATALDFTDNLPAGVEVAATPNASTTCTGGTITAVAATTTISYTGGSVAAGATCTLSVDVTSVTPGMHVNLTGDLMSSSGNSGTATDTLTVTAPPAPTFAKVFAPNPIAAGGTSTLTFTIDNSGALVPATSLDFTDNLPAGVEVAATPNATNTCTGGTLTAVAASTVISYTGGTVAASASCQISVDVTSAVAGMHVNLTGDLTSSSGNSGTATDTLTVDPPPVPTFAKVFAPDSIAAGATSTLTFTIDNAGALVPATSLDFTDNLPAGVEVAATPNATNTCTGGTLTAVAASTVISYTGGTVAASASCQISVDVTSAVAGMHINLTGDLTSSSGNSGTATDTLTVTAAPVPTFAKAFAPTAINLGEISTLTFTIDNTGALVAATSLDFTDNLPAGTEVAATPNASTTCTGGTLTAVAASGTVSYTGGSVAAGASCEVVVDITSATDGIYVNTTGDLTSSLGNSGTASDTLAVTAGLSLSKTFETNPVTPGSMVDLTYVLNNDSATSAASGIGFTDDLGAVLPGLVAVALPADDSCGLGSTVTGASTITLAGGVLPAGGSCTFTVTLQVPASAAPGDYTSTTSSISAIFGGVPLTFGDATAVLTVLSVLTIPTVGDFGLWLLALALLGVAIRQIRTI